MFVWLALCACGHPAAHDTTTKPPPAAESDASCPLEVPGTSVTEEDTIGGGALVFVTTGDAASVYARAQKFAIWHRQPVQAGHTFAATGI